MEFFRPIAKRWKTGKAMPVRVTSPEPEVGLKFDKEKPDMSLLSSVALLEVAKVMTYGKVKYSKDNWRKGIQWTRCIAAALRHIFAWLGGETYDPETGINHLAHASCGLMFLLEYTKTHPEMDDRYINKPSDTTESYL